MDEQKAAGVSLSVRHAAARIVEDMGWRDPDGNPDAQVAQVVQETRGRLRAAYLFGRPLPRKVWSGIRQLRCEPPLPAPMAVEPWAPACMTAEEWITWSAMNPAALTGGNVALRPCQDCPPSWYHQMRRQGLCNGLPAGMVS